MCLVLAHPDVSKLLVREGYSVPRRFPGAWQEPGEVRRGCCAAQPCSTLPVVEAPQALEVHPAGRLECLQVLPQGSV